MALKSIIDIDVNDGSFQRFSAMFARYQAQLQGMPGQWAQVGAAAQTATAAAAGGAEATAEAAQGTAGAMAQAAASLNSIVAAAAGAAFQLGRASSTQRGATASARAQATAWHDTARSARSFATHIGDATRSLLRWASITGVISGILGGGGLFGIDRLAISAGNERRSSLGLGVSAGEEKAFSLNYGRVVDTNQFLGGVNESLHDVTRRHALYGAGLTERDIAGKDTAQVSADLLPALKRLADQTPQAMLAQTLKARNLDQFMSLQDFERLKNTPAGEIAEYGKRYQADRVNLNTPDPELKAWQDLQVQFGRSWKTLENTFIRGLVALAEPIGKLSEAFTKAVAALLSSPQLKEWIADLGTGIKWLADYMLDDKFHQKVLDFAKGVGDFVAAIGSAITAIDGWVAWFRGKTPGEAASQAGQAFTTKAFSTIEDSNPRTPGSPAQQFARRPDIQAHAADFQSFEEGYKLPTGTLDAVEFQESRGRDVNGPTLKDGTSAKGFFQFTDPTAAHYGVNPHDEKSSAKGAATYLHDLLNEFHGDWEKSLAAYNWGPGNVEKDVAEYGDKWREHLPNETKNYISSVSTYQANAAQTAANSGRNNVVTVTVNNNTGGNAYVSSSQLVK